MKLNEAKELLKKNGFIVESNKSINAKIRKATVFTGTSSDKDILINELENTYGFFIAERHPEVEVVHSAKEFSDLTGVRETTAADEYGNSVKAFFGQKYEGSVMWPEVYESTFSAEEGPRYFETREDLAEYILSGENPNLQIYFNNYTPPKPFSISNLYNESGFAKSMDKLGIPAAAGVTMFVLYELVQYGLAIPTEGASLALPF